MDEEGADGMAEILIRINLPPSGGELVAQPQIGTALFTDFQLSSCSWSDEDLPLAYGFYYILGGGEMSLGGTQGSCTGSAFLQEGPVETNHSWTVAVHVIDSMGAVAAAITEVQVLAPTQDKEEEFDEKMQLDLENAVATGDHSTVTQLVLGISASLKNDQPEQSNSTHTSNTTQEEQTYLTQETQKRQQLVQIVAQSWDQAVHVEEIGTMFTVTLSHVLTEASELDNSTLLQSAALLPRCVLQSCIDRNMTLLRDWHNWFVMAILISCVVADLWIHSVLKQWMPP